MSGDDKPDDLLDFLLGFFAVGSLLFVTGCMVWLAVTAT